MKRKEAKWGGVGYMMDERWYASAEVKPPEDCDIIVSGLWKEGLDYLDGLFPILEGGRDAMQNWLGGKTGGEL